MSLVSCISACTHSKVQPANNEGRSIVHVVLTKETIESKLNNKLAMTWHNL